MALFSRKSAKKTSGASGKAAPTAAKSTDSSADTAGKQTFSRSVKPVITGPRITEKAVAGNDRGVYVFDVTTDATKAEIKKAVKSLYDVDPVAVRVVNHSGKVKRRGNTLGRTAKSRKAYVTLPAGTTIELV